MNNKRIQFVSDTLVEQIISGKKTASVALVTEVAVREDEYNDALIVGEYYDVYDSTFVGRATIRIVGMELCRWDSIPERLWKGEVNQNAEEFRKDHEAYFSNPVSEFEFVAYYFKKVSTEPTR